MNKELLPIKFHYFLFMGGQGPILPQLQLIGKDLGISANLMGIINGVLPFVFLLTKPIFGLLIDVCRQQRKCIFLVVIIIMTLSFTGISLITNENSRSNVAYKSFHFWYFVILMSVGVIGFNIVNSISDTICFDIIDNESEYGKQRLWGSIGFGVTGLISGCLVDLYSTQSSNYTAAFSILLVFSSLDMISCYKLKIPVIEAPSDIIHDLKILLKDIQVVAFLIFATFIGILDSLIIYFLFWYVEDLAEISKTTNVKLIEGLILAAETLGAEVLFFLISGKIINFLGHANSFTLCFFTYLLRFILVSLASNPWWILPIEFFMQGPTFALSYAVIVAYANKVAPSGMSGTMQGIASGVTDGAGYAFGSIIGGLLYQSYGGQRTFQVFSGIALVCGVLHHVLVHKLMLKKMRQSYEIISN